MTELIWRDPIWFWALVVVPLLIHLRGKRVGTLWVLPFASSWASPTWSALKSFKVFLTYLGLILVIIALARPQRAETRQMIQQQGYDLMLAVDLSSSMLARDYERNGRKVNRWEAIRPIIEEFIKGRPNDRIGLVIFSGNAYTLSPLTFDHEWLARHLQKLRIGLIEDGTAIGDGLGLSISRLLKRNDKESKERLGAFVVLMTDGVNNRGNLQPQQAADLAVKHKIPVYTIAAGRNGVVEYPRMTQDGEIVGYFPMQSEVDEPLLQSIAEKTGGNFFRASDTEAAQKAFRGIDQSQKINFQGKAERLTTELFHLFALPALACWTMVILATFVEQRKLKVASQ